MGRKAWMLKSEIFEFEFDCRRFTCKAAEVLLLVLVSQEWESFRVCIIVF